MALRSQLLLAAARQAARTSFSGMQGGSDLCAIVAPLSSFRYFSSTTNTESSCSLSQLLLPPSDNRRRKEDPSPEQQHKRTFASLPNPAVPSASITAVDPFSLVRSEIESVSERLRRCIVTEIPTLEQAAEYFFRAGHEGKRLRSTVILLMATSLASVPTNPLFLTVDDSPADAHPPEQRRRQQRIAEITELIHVASLLHDDVIDNADKRRGLKALNSLFGNKVAILAGDFLLARASVSLAALRNSEVIALMSQVLEHLVAGEILQMTAGPDDAGSMDHYMRKTYFKTASLVANSCKSVALLAGCSPDQSTAAWDYGRHLGLAFQLIDDVLDYTGTTAELGKPAGNDLRSGLATAPVLFAAEQHPELHNLIKRRFRQDGDVETALRLVKDSQGVDRAKQLAEEHARQAIAALERLPEVAVECAAAVESRNALVEITQKVINRRK
ncbi:putative Solanesyl-diphosphate synthase 1, mitochondrial [Nannochloris sp. 'desiccata']|nr:putative Solanesyl-diphosphate synthase 1, mitochondrial [Chlorella desiccata (nom. nud.)]